MDLSKEIIKSCEKLENTVDLARKVVKLFKQYIDSLKWDVAGELLTSLNLEVEKLEKTSGLPIVVKNMVYRILKIIRDEHATMCKGAAMAGSTEPPKPVLHKVFSMAEIDYSESAPGLKEAIQSNLSELLSELESSTTAIAEQALNHIYPEDVIMTFGYSRTVIAFLKAAAAKRTIHVIVVKGPEHSQGSKMSVELVEAGIDTTLVYDSNIFALMPKVCKVVIGSLIIMDNSSIKTFNGAHMLLVTAKHFSVPVIVCSGLHKVSIEMMHLCREEEPNQGDPASIWDTSDVDKRILDKTSFFVPLYDYIPGEYITLFLFNTGACNPSFVYRVKRDLYYDPKGMSPSHCFH